MAVVKWGTLMTLKDMLFRYCVSVIGIKHGFPTEVEDRDF